MGKVFADITVLFSASAEDNLTALTDELLRYVVVRRFVQKLNIITQNNNIVLNFSILNCVFFKHSHLKGVQSWRGDIVYDIK